MLRGKKILIGVTGSIAAYKTAYLVRNLKKLEAEVKVVMTSSASDFIGPVTLSTLSKNPVSIDFYDAKTGDWDNHVELGLWADLMIVAPATANTIGKMANGLCDNLLLATYLSARCPVWVAPAMDLDMFQHPSVQANLDKLTSFGNRIIEPKEGELASGLEGKGRMEEPEEIAELIQQYFSSSNLLSGKKVLVTAGPTYEAIDPVRFIGNHSSGKMGIDIADVLAANGADVTLICGPSTIESKADGVKRLNVMSAHEMFEAAKQEVEEYDIAVMAAAVADYTPSKPSDEKVKKKDGDLAVELNRTRDILRYFGEHKKKQQVLVGFAMETQNEVENAQRKAVSKNADFIVLNSLRDEGAGFKEATNKVSFVYNNGDVESFELKSKQEVAQDIMYKVVELMK